MNAGGVDKACKSNEVTGGHFGQLNINSLQLTTMKTFRFLEFEVYKDSKRFYQLIVAVCKKFPKEFYSLVDQLRRCALSVILNIAEGSAKKSDRDFNRYIENALGSINEAVAALDVAISNKLITEEEFTLLRELAEDIAKQSGGFSKKLEH